MPHVMYGSVTRIAELPTWPFHFEALDREKWEAADYVVAEVASTVGPDAVVELASGRQCNPMAGDLIVGALARRAATLEAVGSFEDVGPDGAMHVLTGGGGMGKVTSCSRFSGPMVPVRYRGHLLEGSRKLRMPDFVPEAPDLPFELPVVLIAGTSMSAGKTLAGRVAVKQLKTLGHTVIGAKLCGAGRWRDTLSFADAGADHTFDFVDAGLPSTVVLPDGYRTAISGLLSRMAATNGSVMVVEAGASPLEPYNGGTLVELLGDRIRFTIVSASDPYAVVGIRDAWGRSIDLVCGPTANTTAGVALVHELTGLPSLDLLNPASYSGLRQRLEAAVGARGNGKGDTA
jgi:hypothetical protein